MHLPASRPSRPAHLPSRLLPCLCLLLCACAAAMSVPEVPGEMSGLRLQGRVYVGAEAGTPVGGAEVSLWAPAADPGDPTAQALERTATAEDGRFELPVPAGWEGRPARILFRAGGYEARLEPLVLPGPNDDPSVVQLVELAPDAVEQGPRGSGSRGPGPRTAYGPGSRPIFAAPGPELRSRVEGADPEGAVLAPLPGLRAGGLHHLILVPPFAGTTVAARGSRTWELTADAALEDYAHDQAGRRVRVDGLYSQTSLRGRWGLGGGYEVWAAVPAAGRSGKLEISNLEGVTRKASWAFGDFQAGLRRRAWTLRSGAGALAWGLHLKLPTGSRDDVLSTGGADLAGTVAVHHVLDPDHPEAGRIHLEAGLVVTGKQNLFLDNADLDQVWTWAAGYALPAPRGAWLFQVQGHTSAFDSLAYGDTGPASLMAGLRRRAGEGWLEAGLGLGLNDAASRSSLLLGYTRAY